MGLAELHREGPEPAPWGVIKEVHGRREMNAINNYIEVIR
jgi:hypothetical protein